MHLVRSAFAAGALSVSSLAPLALAQTVSRVSVDSSGSEASSGSYSPSISADGRFVAFHSFASNLDPNDTNGVHDVFLRDRLYGVTERASVDRYGQEGNGDSAHPSISANGRFVAFHSLASNLVPGDFNNDYDVFVRDRDTGLVVQASVDSSGRGSYGRSWFPSISADGRYVAFWSDAATLVPGDTNGYPDVFVHDLVSGATVRASVSSSGAEGNRQSDFPAMSADGRFVVFGSQSDTLDASGQQGAFRHDLLTGETINVSNVGYGLHPAVSADGRYVAFTEWFELRAVYVWDALTSSSTLASVRTDGSRLRWTNVHPALSANGRYLVFVSMDDEAVPNDGNVTADVFVRDFQTLLTTLVSSTPSGSSGNGCSAYCDNQEFGPAISADGRVIAFFSHASDLVSGDTNAASDVFVSDRSNLPPVFLADVLPRTGSAAGGDLVHLIGSGFTTVSDTTVLIGGVTIPAISVSANRIDVRTPPGQGAADVTVINSPGYSWLPAYYTYVAPELAARYGNVNVGAWTREDVMTVGLRSHGDDLRREISISEHYEFHVNIAAPSSRSSASFVLYVWPGAPGAATLTALPRGLGFMVFPAPFTRGSPQPRMIYNNIGYEAILGSPRAPSAPAPTRVINFPDGTHRRVTVTLQGLIQDDASVSPAGYSVTNAIIVHFL